MDRIKDAVIHFSYFIKARPKNVKGWKELIRCLYESEYYEEALEQVNNAQRNTNHKPLFDYYKSAILFELGKSKEAMLFLQLALKNAPAMVTQFIQLNPSLLQNSSIVEIISANKNLKSRKKKL
jgi:tetratricopeptide (TPR) repeat protein